MKKIERERMAYIKQMPCIVCGRYGVDVHHIDTGIGRKKNHMKTIPLCSPNNVDDGCHKGGVHKGKKAWQERIGATEYELLGRTNKQLPENLR